MAKITKKTELEINTENTQDILEKKFLEKREGVKRAYREELEKLDLEYSQLTNVMLEYIPEVKRDFGVDDPDCIIIKIALFRVDVEYFEERGKRHSKRYYKDFLNLNILKSTNTYTAGRNYCETGYLYYYKIGYIENEKKENILFKRLIPNSKDTITFQELISHFKDTATRNSVLIPFEGNIKKYIVSKLSGE